MARSSFVAGGHGILLSVSCRGEEERGKRGGVQGVGLDWRGLRSDADKEEGRKKWRRVHGSAVDTMVMRPV
jgi:hypothetical protein